VKIVATTALCLTVLLANPYADGDFGNEGVGAVLLWPTARSTALAGAVTGLADEADAAFFNPAGLAFQTTAKVDITCAELLPGLYPGMLYGSAIGGAPIRLPFWDGHRTYVSGGVVYRTTGETDIVNERGEFLGRVTTWRGWAGLQLAMLLTERFGTGIGLKIIRDSRYHFGWDYGHYAEGTAVAVDMALLYRHAARVAIGAAVDNLGPGITYAGSGEHDPLPAMLRLGACWTPVESHDFILRMMPQLDKLLVGMFRDTTGRKPLGRQLQEEWRDVRKAFALEVTAFNSVSLRIGYFEDPNNQLGGIVLKNVEGQTFHYGAWDALTREGLGQLKSIGLCWGFGFGSDVIRFDLSSDAAIYDFPTKNWKFQLTCNDLGRLFGRRS